MPDSAIAVADEIVLVDLPPEALIARLRAGKVYPRERVDAALNQFFRIENLVALRVVALREVASQAIQERLLALVTPDRRAQRVAAAPRAPRSGWAASSTCSTSAPPGASRARASASSRGAAPARRDARRAPPARGGRRGRRDRRAASPASAARPTS